MEGERRASLDPVERVPSEHHPPAQMLAASSDLIPVCMCVLPCEKYIVAVDAHHPMKHAVLYNARYMTTGTRHLCGACASVAGCAPSSAQATQTRLTGTSALFGMYTLQVRLGGWLHAPACTPRLECTIAHLSRLLVRARPGKHTNSVPDTARLAPQHGSLASDQLKRFLLGSVGAVQCSPEWRQWQGPGGVGTASTRQRKALPTAI